MSFQPDDSVVASTDLGGLLRGKVPAGTPGVVSAVDDTGSQAALYTVTFTIVDDDLLMPHQTTLGQLTEDQLLIRGKPSSGGTGEPTES
jgi:hypothetical protein